MAESTGTDVLATGAAPNPTDQLLSMVAPQVTAPQFNSAPIAPRDLATTPIAAPEVAPEVPQTGVSPSIADQLRKIAQNTNALAASNPAAASQPMGWARTLLGGALATFGGGGINLGSPQPGPLASTGIGGIQNAINQRRQQTQEAQARADELKQRQFENNLKLKDESRKEEAQNYQRMAYAFQMHAAMQHMTDEMNDRMAADNTAYVKAAEEGGASPIPGAERLTWDQVQDMAKQHATQGDPSTGVPADPMGVNWLTNQNYHQVGWENVLDKNGDPIPIKDAQGTVTGVQRQPVFSLMTWGDKRTVDKDFADDLTKHGLATLPVGTELNPRDARSFEVQLQHKKAEEAASDTALAAAGKTKDEIAQYQQNAAYREAQGPWMHWLSDAKGDPGLAMTNLQEHADPTNPANMDPKTGQPTPESMEASRQLGLVEKGMGKDIIKTLSDNFEKQTEANIKANAAAAKGQPLPLEGDPKLHGDAYINSLPPGRQAVIRQIVSGQMGAMNSRMLAYPQGQLIMQEASQADPDLDVSQIGSYPALLKDFNVGRAAQQIKAINTAVPHLDDLYKAIENGFGTTVPGLSYLERKAGNQNAIDVNNLRTIASQELAKIYATGAVTDQERKEFDDQLKGFQTPDEMKGTIFAMINALNRQVESLDNQWKEGLPSPHWQPRRAIVDNIARQSMADVISRHNGAGPVTQTPAQEQAASNQRLTAAAGGAPKPAPVSVGGKQIVPNTDGTYTVGGHSYVLAPDGKSLTLAPQPQGAK